MGTDHDGNKAHVLTLAPMGLTAAYAVDTPALDTDAFTTTTSTAALLERIETRRVVAVLTHIWSEIAPLAHARTTPACSVMVLLSPPSLARTTSLDPT